MTSPKGIPDERIIEEWEKTPSYAKVARALGMSRQGVMYRVLKIRAAGVQLKPAGDLNFKDPEQARAAGFKSAEAKRRKHVDRSTGLL